jgi:hypothetical protein
MAGSESVAVEPMSKVAKDATPSKYQLSPCPDLDFPRGTAGQLPSTKLVMS